MNQRVLVLLKSKTFWGAVCATGGWLVSQPHIGPTELLQAGGALLGAAGVRDSITKLSSPPSP